MKAAILIFMFTVAVVLAAAIGYCRAKTDVVQAGMFEYNCTAYRVVPAEDMTQ